MPFLTKVISSFKVAATTGKTISPFEDRKLLLVDRNNITNTADINLTASRYNLDEKISSKYNAVFLHEVCDLKNGYAFKSSDYIEKSNTCNFRMSYIRPDGGIDLDHNTKYLPDDYAIKYQDFLVEEGDVVIAMTDMANDPKILGVPTIVKKDKRTLLLNQRVGKFCNIDHDRLYLPYLKYILNSQTVKEYYKSLGGGGLQINISKKDILSLSIPLPPIFIQKEIAVEIESYQKIIDGARQVVENYKPRIDIDPKWEMVELETVCDHITKGTTPTTNGYKFQESGINFIKIESINTDGTISSDKMSYIDETCHNDFKRSQLNENDILFSIAGTKMGITGIVDR